MNGSYRLAILLFFCVLQVFAQETETNSVPSNRDEDLSDVATLEVHEFRFTGNTVFSNDELRKVLSSYSGREIDSEELEDARQALTRHYTSHGYINSGAVLPDQKVKDGVVVFKVIEGRLSEVEIEGNHAFRTRFIRKRIAAGAGSPLNFNRLEDTLYLMRDDLGLKRINAELKPSGATGESILHVSLAERSRWSVGMQARNDRPPSVGAEMLELIAADRNVTGNNDALDARYGIAQRSPNGLKPSELDNLGLAYQLPLTIYNTTVQLSYTRADYAIIEEPFEQLDIKSHSDFYTVAIRQPIIHTPRTELAFSVIGERRHSESFLLGEPFSFSPGAVNGEATSSALKFQGEFVARDLVQLFALRSTLNWGVDLLGATRNDSGPDGRFFSWIGQAEYVRRIADTGLQSVFRVNGQWSSEALLSLDQFSIGGANTVRGYRENQLVRDRGIVASAELRIPILQNKGGGPLLQLAPFFDYGRGWNVGAEFGGSQDLMSTGAGLLLTWTDRVFGQLYWGYALNNPTPTHGHDLQDYGIHFRLVVMAL